MGIENKATYRKSGSQSKTSQKQATYRKGASTQGKTSTKQASYRSK